ncbi:MAG TPA: hypothetical protein VEK08_20375 [Planctomycetota bacterium]|nr:hypothetical protein [Planctomycetota bacterium]
MSTEAELEKNQEMERRLKAGLAVRPMSPAVRERLSAAAVPVPVHAPPHARNIWRVAAALAALAAGIAAAVFIDRGDGPQKRIARPTEDENTIQARLYDLQPLILAAQNDEALRSRFFVVDAQPSADTKALASAILAHCATVSGGSVSLLEGLPQLQALGPARYQAQVQQLLQELARKERPADAAGILLSFVLIETTPGKLSELLAGIKPAQKPAGPWIVEAPDAAQIRSRAEKLGQIMQSPRVVSLPGELFTLSVGEQTQYVSDYDKDTLKPVKNVLELGMRSAGVARINSSVTPTGVNVSFRLQYTELQERIKNRARSKTLPPGEFIEIDAQDRPLDEIVAQIAEALPHKLSFSTRNPAVPAVSFHFEGRPRQALAALAVEYGLTIVDDKAGTVRVEDPQRVTRNFDKADVHEIVRYLAMRAEKRIVLDSRVSGVESLRFDNVPWRTALERLAKARDCVILGSDSLQIIPRTALSQKVDIRVFRPRYLSAASVLYTSVSPITGQKSEVTLLDAMQKVSSFGTISADKKTGQIVVRDAVAGLDALQTFLEQVDLPPLERTPDLLLEQMLTRRCESRFGAELSAGRALLACILPTHSGLDEAALPVAGHSRQELTPMPLSFLQNSPERWYLLPSEINKRLREEKVMVILMSAEPDPSAKPLSTPPEF